MVRCSMGQYCRPTRREPTVCPGFVRPSRTGIALSLGAPGLAEFSAFWAYTPNMPAPVDSGHDTSVATMFLLPGGMPLALLRAPQTFSARMIGLYRRHLAGGFRPWEMGANMSSMPERRHRRHRRWHRKRLRRGIVAFSISITYDALTATVHHM